ncbi:hypothetical protein HYPSUDRAFT_42482 [Hypholoma sublateritium FD-334 SS-4]|uniref:DUF6699 domain-containing protein n=1 Tax=Hypholoma sublateritium (strain FD-334 SS-4) TaxID=945553 RepID=A0A0D2NQN6_HYPSF|nr:hypothetical protein HYPSUDRAFT_42482 [Hypholoma sublateritium FD-334 SS-4]
MDRAVSRWAPGASYGPVLGQTDLYLLGRDAALEVNPLLKGEVPQYQMQFHVVTGFSSSNRNQGDTSVQGKDEPATLPRVTQIILISRFSPWCTIIKKDTGVTIGDICSAIYKDYVEHEITDAEYATLSQRAQDQLKRTAAQHFNNQMQPQGGQWGYYTPQQAPDRLRRVDWLRERVYFEGLSKDDNYVQSRLGFKAPNIFVMDLTS